MKRTIITAALVVCLAALSAEAVEKVKVAKEKPPEEALSVPVEVTATPRDVQGEVSGVGKKFISVVYARDAETASEEEIYIPLNQADIKLDHFKSFDDIQIGDVVYVQFEEIQEISGGQCKDKRRARMIGFVRRPLASEEEAEE